MNEIMKALVGTQMTLVGLYVALDFNDSLFPFVGRALIAIGTVVVMRAAFRDSAR